MKCLIGLMLLTVLVLIGCHMSTPILDSRIRVFNSKQFDNKYSEIIDFNLRNEPELLAIIKSFKSNNLKAALEDMVILDFLSLQICKTDAGSQFQDYPNDLQAVFNFYQTMSKQEITWIRSEKMTILKYISVSFISKYASEKDAMEYLKINLRDCKNDSSYARFLIGSSDLNNCHDKRIILERHE